LGLKISGLLLGNVAKKLLLNRFKGEKEKKKMEGGGNKIGAESYNEVITRKGKISH